MNRSKTEAGFQRRNLFIGWKGLVVGNTLDLRVYRAISPHLQGSYPLVI